jgi:hypothetical protein
VTEVETNFKQPTSKRGSATAEELAFMAAAKMSPCRGCGRHGPNDFHHARRFGAKRNHMKGFSLCPDCHRPGRHGSLHSDRKGWERAHGTEESHVRATHELLGVADQ